MDCATVSRALSDGDGRVVRRRDLRAHLRTCADCRRFRAEIENREQDLAALAPLPAAAAAGLVQALLGGGAPPGGTGAAGAATVGGTAKALGSSAALKSAAAVLAIAAIGTGAAERGGLIDLGLPGGRGSKAASAQRLSDPDAPTSATAAAGQSPSGATTRASQRGSGGLRSALAKAVKGTAGVQATSKARSTGLASGTGSGDQADATASPAPTKGAIGGAPPHGKDHEKQHPATKAHGQQTAAAHKAASHGTAGQSHSSQPGHPARPVHPSHSGGGVEKSPPGTEKAPHEGGAGVPEAAPVEKSAAPGFGHEGDSARGEAVVQP